MPELVDAAVWRHEKLDDPDFEEPEAHHVTTHREAVLAVETVASHLDCDPDVLAKMSRSDLASVQSDLEAAAESLLELSRSLGVARQFGKLAAKTQR